MRIVVFNMRYGTGTGWQYHMPFPFSGYFNFSTKKTTRIANYLESLDADIICLVEVDGGSYRHRNLCQADRIASMEGWNHYFCNKYGNNPLLCRMPIFSSQGNAVLSKLPVLSSKEHYLSKGMKKTVLEVEFPDFHVLLAHLPLGRRARKAQLQELAHKCKDLDKPVLLGGDFNLLHGSMELHYLLKKTGLRDADRMAKPTYPSKAPRLRLDRLLVSEEISVNKLEVPHVPLSDHLPLVCDFNTG